MLKRRTLLLTGAGAAVGAAAGVATLRDRRNRQRLKDFLDSVEPKPRTLDAHAATGALSDGESATIVALAEVLYPPQPGDDVAAFVREHTDRRCTQESGWLVEYRNAAQLLDERAVSRSGKAFAALPPAERDAVLRSLLWSYSGRRFVGAVGRYLENATASTDALTLRHVVMADLLAAFYESPRGWAVVGYTHFPGVPAADPRDYTRPLRG